MVRRSPAVMFSRGGREDRDFTTVPYTGRMYDRAVCSGGLTRDADTGRSFRQAVEGEPLWLEYFQRACAWSLSTSARASSVMLSNSGHGR